MALGFWASASFLLYSCSSFVFYSLSKFLFSTGHHTLLGHMGLPTPFTIENGLGQDLPTKSQTIGASVS